jgi:hypothetical protein
MCVDVAERAVFSVRLRAIAAVRTAVLWVTLCSPVSWCHAASPVFEDLLSHVPVSSNLMALIDVEGLRAAPVLKASQASSASGASENRHLIPPTEISQVVVAAQIRGFRHSLIESQAAFLKLMSEPSLPVLIARYGGSLEKAAGSDYADLNYGAAVFRSAAKTLAVVTPSDRPIVTQLMRATQSKQPKPSNELSPYLREAVNAIPVGVSMTIALDLESLFSSRKIVNYLSECETMKSRATQVDVAAQLLSQLRGVTVHVRAKQDIQAEMTLDFSVPAETAKEWGQPLLIEILSDLGATLDGMSAWQMEFRGQQIRYSGVLSIGDFRQLFSLWEFPTEISPGKDPTELTEAQQKERTLTATFERFRATEQLIKDLRSDRRIGSGSGERALWWDKYARKIESLPTLHVDPEMVAYCDDVVLRLRVQATRYRMVGIKAGQYTQVPNYFWTAFGNYYGSIYTVGAAESDFTAVKRFESAAAAAGSAEQFQAIDTATTAIRRQMTERYGLEF